MTSPHAAVKFFDTVGTLLVSGYYPAPFYLGDQPAINGNPYMVTKVDWPFRDATGKCQTGTDWEYVTVVPYQQPPSK